MSTAGPAPDIGYTPAKDLSRLRSEVAGVGYYTPDRTLVAGDKVLHKPWFGGALTPSANLPAHDAFKGQFIPRESVEWWNVQGKLQPFAMHDGNRVPVDPRQVLGGEINPIMRTTRHYAGLDAHSSVKGQMFTRDQVSALRVGDHWGYFAQNSAGQMVPVESNQILHRTAGSKAAGAVGEGWSWTKRVGGEARAASGRVATAAVDAVPHMTGLAGSALRTGGKGLLFASGAVALGAIGGGMLLDRQASAGMSV